MPITRRDFLAGSATVASTAAPDFSHAAEHGHDHPHTDLPSDMALRVKTIESLMVEKGLVDAAAIDALVQLHETRVGPRNGARVVAKAWIDAEFKQKLLANGTKVIAEMGFGGRQAWDVIVVENTASVHNLIVCTLCSCYPWSLLGLAPTWYKSTAYRSRAVVDPRGVLKEFGTEIGEDVEVRVWDSTADQRYFVLPERPPGTEGMSEEVLVGLVTRDSMIGATRIQVPGKARAT